MAHIRLPDEDWCVILAYSIMYCRSVCLFACVYRMNQRKYSILRNNAYMIMRGVLDALTGTSENQCQILHHLIDYFIFVISEKFKKQHGDEATVCLKKLDEHDWPAKAVELIDQWLQNVIGHVKFGGVQLKKIGDEVHVSFAHNLCHAVMHVYPMYRYGECYSQEKIQTNDFGSNGV